MRVNGKLIEIWSYQIFIQIEHSEFIKVPNHPIVYVGFKEYCDGILCELLE